LVKAVAMLERVKLLSSPFKQDASYGLRGMGQLRIKLTPHESRNQRLGNPVIEDRP